MPSLTTRSNLIPAIIRSDDPMIGGPVLITCSFNPYEYTIMKTNKFKETAEQGEGEGESGPALNFEKPSPQQLKLKLIFDTYETGGDLIGEYIKPLWRLMASEVQEQGNQKKRPPHVVFEWGPFAFRSYITKMQQKFVLFDQLGRPQRAKVDVTFTQYGSEDTEDFPGQNPTSGGGDIVRIWTVKGGERLENIAYEVYGESSEWRRIAYHNNLSNPSDLLPGSKLVIPTL